MCCEQLVCAACAGPVVDARCPVCRVGRAQVHGSAAPHLNLLALVTLLLVALAVVAALSG